MAMDPALHGGSRHPNVSDGEVDGPLFAGVFFALAGFDPGPESKVIDALERNGATNIGSYDNESCTHVIVSQILYDDPICVAARKHGKIVVTNLWIKDCFELASIADASNVLYRPLRDQAGIRGSEALVICLTGYQGQARKDIMRMVEMMGGRFTKPLIATQVTHLICYKFEGDKHRLAKQLGIKLVNHRWLEDCLKEWTLLSESSYSMSGWELEMLEAEAKDSEGEEEDVVKASPTGALPPAEKHVSTFSVECKQEGPIHGLGQSEGSKIPNGVQVMCHSTPRQEGCASFNDDNVLPIHAGNPKVATSPRMRKIGASPGVVSHQVVDLEIKDGELNQTKDGDLPKLESATEAPITNSDAVNHSIEECGSPRDCQNSKSLKASDEKITKFQLPDLAQNIDFSEPTKVVDASEKSDKPMELPYGFVEQIGNESPSSGGHEEGAVTSVLDNSWKTPHKGIVEINAAKEREESTNPHTHQASNTAVNKIILSRKPVVNNELLIESDADVTCDQVLPTETVEDDALKISEKSSEICEGAVKDDLLSEPIANVVSTNITTMEDRDNENPVVVSNSKKRKCRLSANENILTESNDSKPEEKKENETVTQMPLAGTNKGSPQVGDKIGVDGDDLLSGPIGNDVPENVPAIEDRGNMTPEVPSTTRKRRGRLSSKDKILGKLKDSTSELNKANEATTQLPSTVPENGSPQDSDKPGVDKNGLLSGPIGNNVTVIEDGANETPEVLNTTGKRKGRSSSKDKISGKLKDSTPDKSKANAIPTQIPSTESGSGSPQVGDKYFMDKDGLLCGPIAMEDSGNVIPEVPSTTRKRKGRPSSKDKISGKLKDITLQNNKANEIATQMPSTGSSNGSPQAGDTSGLDENGLSSGPIGFNVTALEDGGNRTPEVLNTAGKRRGRSSSKDIISGELKDSTSEKNKANGITTCLPSAGSGNGPPQVGEKSEVDEDGLLSGPIGNNVTVAEDVGDGTPEVLDSTRKGRGRSSTKKKIPRYLKDSTVEEDKANATVAQLLQPVNRSAEITFAGDIKEKEGMNSGNFCIASNEDYEGNLHGSNKTAVDVLNERLIMTGKSARGKVQEVSNQESRKDTREEKEADVLALQAANSVKKSRNGRRFMAESKENKSSGGSVLKGPFVLVDVLNAAAPGNNSKTKSAEVNCGIFAQKKTECISEVADNEVIEVLNGSSKGSRKVSLKEKLKARVLSKASYDEKENQTATSPLKTSCRNSKMRKINNTALKEIGDESSAFKSGLLLSDATEMKDATESKDATEMKDANLMKLSPRDMWFAFSGRQEERKQFKSIVNSLGGRLCRDSHHWSPQTTHLVLAAQPRRTEKFFAAAAGGRWILTKDYLESSKDLGRFVDEEQFEWYGSGMNEDCSISLEAPRKWRMFMESTGCCAFYGLRVLVYGECIIPSLETLRRAIGAGGGTLLATVPPYNRFLALGMDFAIVSPGTPKEDTWVQQFLSHRVACVTTDYFVEYVCKPHSALDRHILYETQAFVEEALNRMEDNVKRSCNDVVNKLIRRDGDDMACARCGKTDREEIMLLCGDGKRRGCGTPMHIDCCQPPLTEVPEEDWYCEQCCKKLQTLAGGKRKKRKKVPT